MVGSEFGTERPDITWHGSSGPLEVLVDASHGDMRPASQDISCIRARERHGMVRKIGVVSLRKHCDPEG